MDKITKWVWTGTLTLMGGLALTRFITSQVSKGMIHTIMTDPYAKNLAEFYSATSRTGIQDIIETNLRAEEGRLILRPLGSPRKFVDFDGLMFNTAHLSPMSTPLTEHIDTSITIGKRAPHPLRINTPLLISGMAYGLGVSEKFKYALAYGSTLAETASNTGEGPFLPYERELANNLIIQYPRAPWNRNPSILQQADAVEIQIGQGASASTAHRTPPGKINTRLRRRLGIAPSQQAVIHAHMPELDSFDGLPKLVAYLRDLTDGVPIGIKFSFTHGLEENIDLCLEADVDYLALEGAQAATIGAPPILEDDFGLPTLIGLCRTVDHLRRRQAQDHISLIVGGGFKSPGQCLKALALGADAVYLGTTVLFAASHTQILHALPWEPPTQLVIEGGKASSKFNWKKGAQSLAKYLQSANAEIKEGIRTLGKHSLSEINEEDLVALDKTTSEITGIPLAYSSRNVQAVFRPGSK